LSVLRRGVQKYPRSSSLLVCFGEVLSQVGDPAGALQSYLKASRLEPGHPMPYLNASRVYQQLNQMQLAKLHMKRALQLDDALSLTLVDIAQYKIQQNKKQSLLLTTPQHSAPGTSSCSSSLGTSVHHQEDQQPISIDNLVDEMSVTEILDYALSQARHVSEILDIFTAKQIATFYQDLQDKGLVSCIV
jgi:tetratricopeptide (TPR) repeat protein